MASGCGVHVDGRRRRTARCRATTPSTTRTSGPSMRDGLVDDVIALVGVDGHVEGRLARPGRGHEAVEAVEVVGLGEALAVQQAPHLEDGVGVEEAVGRDHRDPAAEDRSSSASAAAIVDLPTATAPATVSTTAATRPRPPRRAATGVRRGRSGTGRHASQTPSGRPGGDKGYSRRSTTHPREAPVMGLLDRFKKTAGDVKEKAEDLADDHGDEAKDAIDKAADCGLGRRPSSTTRSTRAPTQRRTPSTSSQATTRPSRPRAGGGPASLRAGKADHVPVTRTARSRGPGPGRLRHGPARATAPNRSTPSCNRPRPPSPRPSAAWSS